MFNNIIILNENPKQPLKALDAIMPLEDFVDFIKEFLENKGEVDFSCNEYQQDCNEFRNFVKSIDSDLMFSELPFHSIYPTYGTILAVPNFFAKKVDIHFIIGCDDFWEYEVCDDCLQTLFGCDEEPEEKPHILKMLNEFPIIQHDESRVNEFSHQACDCCGKKLAGRRHFLICEKEA